MMIQTPGTRRQLQELLLELDLIVEGFEEALFRAAVDRRTFSAGAPSMAPEFVRWARTVQYLHDGLVSMPGSRWSRTDDDGLPVFANRTHRKRLMVSSGDAFAGSPYELASNRNPKLGPGHRRMTQENFREIQPEIPGLEVKREKTFENWVLLYCERDDGIHAELCVPASIEGGYYKAVLRRIVFPELPLADQHFRFSGDDDGEEFGFKIRRR